MKYNLDTYAQKDPLEILPGMPYGPDILDTSAMRSVLPALIVRVFAMLRPEGIERGALARLWEVRRMFISVYKAEVYNIKLWFLGAMQANRDWQRQVREDLGGEAALARWDKRYAKMKAGETAKESPAPKPVRDTSRRTKRKVKTDRFYLFQLAPIRKDTARTPSVRPPQYRCSYRPAAIHLGLIGPIWVRPDQLRETASPSRVPFAEPGQRVSELSCSSNNAPSLSLEDIINAKNKIINCYRCFNLNILHLDIEINFPARPKDPIPI